MKNKFLVIALVLFAIPCLFAGCFGDGKVANNTTDLVAQSTTNEEGKTYYTCKRLSLVTEINGSYSVGRPFVLDEENEWNRVYDNVYLYQGDYFYMDRTNSWEIYCTLSDPNDDEYVEIAKEGDVDIRINVKKQGIYRIVFNISTVSFDLEFKSEITTPVYEEIKGCDIYSVATKWVQMQKTGDEFVVNNFSVASDKFISFYSHNVHTSNYKVTLAEGFENDYAKIIGEKPDDLVYMKVGGTYNIYINAKTYVVRIVPVA